MKKIACFASDSKLLDKVTDFCSAERFELVDVSSGTIEHDISIIIFITDDPSFVESADLKNIPACVVGDQLKVKDGIYKLNSDFRNIHLRCLVDAVCHNGVYDNVLGTVSPTSISKTMEIDNDIFNVEKIIFALTREFVYFIDFFTLEKIRVGLAEMITNAIEHGNLGITGDQKCVSTDEGTYFDLINERLKADGVSDKKVIFHYEISKEYLKIRIKDEGEGFDVKSLPDPTSQDALLNLHGRGILITRMYFNELIYNDKGNEVQLVKRFK